MPVRTFETVYQFDPGWGKGEEFEKNNLFGVAGTLWSESINSPERIFYQAYPRSLILAEAGWSAQKEPFVEGLLKAFTPLDARPSASRHHLLNAYRIHRLAVKGPHIHY